MRSVLTIVGVAGLCSAVRAQLDCGTDLDPESVPLVLARMAAGVYDPIDQRSLNAYVPVTFHVVRRSDGSGGLDDERLVRALDDANRHYSNCGIRFCWTGPTDYIDSDEFYFNIDTLAEINELRSTRVVEGTVNIYFTQNLASEVGSLCGISSFTFCDVQGIVMDNDCTATPSNHSTLSHEIGHYFDLFHTHETLFGEECVACCNCNIAGDLLCDTPADPVLGGHNVSGCKYIGGEQGPCDDDPVYAPDPTNLLSYAPANCRVAFTAQQNFRMAATLARLRPELVWADCPGDNAWNIRAKLLASDGAAEDAFGLAVAISGNTAVVGAFLDDDRGTDSGSAYIFQNVNGVWTQATKLSASDGAANDHFGSSVAIAGDTAVVGAFGDDDRGSDSGAAYVFQKVNGIWTQVTKLHASDGRTDDWFGGSVTLSGDTAVVGAPRDDIGGNGGQGSAYAFQRLTNQSTIYLTFAPGGV